MSVRAPVGPVNICDQKAIIGRGISAIRASDGIHGEYLYYFFKTHENKIASLGTGTTFKAITIEKLSKLQVPIPYKNDKPDLEGQIRIATLLSRIEALIVTRKNNLQQLDDFLKSTFLEMFGDPVRSDKGWEKLPLSKFGSISTGNTPPRKDPSNYGNTYIEWIKTDNIDKNLMYVTKAQECLTEKGVEKGRILENGAVLVACIAGSIKSIGRAAITDRVVAFNQQINAIQPNSSVEPIWLYWLFRLAQKHIQNIPTKGMKKIITKGVFQQIKLIKPPVKAQMVFSHIAEKGYDLKTKLQDSLEGLENLYAALSQKAFKGELDLSRIPLPEEPGPIVHDDNIADQVAVSDKISRLVEYPMSDSDEREKLLHSLLNDYLKEQQGKMFLLDDFWQQADFKVLDDMDESDQSWGMKDYDQVKDWLFELIREGKLEQAFVEDSGEIRDSQIELTVKG